MTEDDTTVAALAALMRSGKPDPSIKQAWQLIASSLGDLVDAAESSKLDVNELSATIGKLVSSAVADAMGRTKQPQITVQAPTVNVSAPNVTTPEVNPTIVVQPADVVVTNTRPSGMTMHVHRDGFGNISHMTVEFAK